MENPLRYDAFKSANPKLFSVYTRNAEKLLQAMEWKEGDIIMDYGCGSGQIISKYLIEITPNPRYICGVDTSPNLVESALGNCKNRENLLFSVGDIMEKNKWTFKENLVNKFVSYLVLCYIRDCKAFFSRVHSFLRPGGQVGMLVPFLGNHLGIPYQLLSKEKWSKYAENNKMMNQSHFAPWSYSEELDAPSVVKDSLEQSGFRIDQFAVEDMPLEFSNLRKFCEFLCVLTSALTTVPKEMENEFIDEMEELAKNNSKGIHQSEDSISVDCKFLNFVATKI